MTSGIPWQGNMRRDVLESAQEAARRAGLPVEEWLNSVIAQSARQAGVPPVSSLQAGVPPVSSLQAGVPPAWSPPADARGGDRDSPDSWRPSSPRRPSGFADVGARLDALSREVDELTRASRARTPAPDTAPASHERLRVADDAPRLDRTGDELPGLAPRGVPPGRPALDCPPGQLIPGTAEPAAATVDEALAEIEARQRALDESPARIELPRAPTQRLGDLEQQLRQINSRIEAIRPCGIDGALETLRDDLAEIGVMLKEAMPRQALDALEAEIRALATRIDTQRQEGQSSSTIAGIERGLGEVRDALGALTPAESLTGVDQALQELSHKIDRIAASGRDPEALKQLEGAIVALRGVVSHVASNDALTQLSQDVRALAVKVDQVSGADAFSALEQRIGAIADALQQTRPGPAPETSGLETTVRSLADKIEQLHDAHADQSALRYLEDRIAKLVEKIDVSDQRLDQLGSIERTLAELLVQTENARMAAGRAGLRDDDATAIKNDVRRTQDALESVHSTLDHVVGRLATIESDIRSTSARTGEALPPQPARAEPVRLEPREAVDHRADTAAVATAPAPTAAEPARANPATAERRPIDPNLPPDHPLEPGAGRRVASPAERIAASEAALEDVRPPVIPDPAGKSDFIAAARRAAQAAIVEAPAAVKDRRIASGGDADDAAAGGGGAIRKIVVGASVVLIVLGAVHFVTTKLWTSPASHSTAQAPVEEPPTAEPPQVTPAAAPDRQSLVLPPGYTLAPNAVDVLTGPPPDSAEPDLATGTVRPRTQQPDTAATPAGARITGGDRLPAALRTAAVAGDPGAEYEVGSRFADGRGVPQNMAEAANWFEKAAAKSLTMAQFRLGGLYEKGVGVRKNLDTARRLYQSAAEAGHAKAMHNLAVLHADGVEGKPNYATAARWFQKAAEHGVIDSQYNLAILYARGIGVETNLAEAFKWFALASREGDRDAIKKRDEVAARLDRQSMAAALAAARAWQAQPQPEAALQVKAPPGGWDAAPAIVKRNVAPKAEPRRAAP